MQRIYFGPFRTFLQILGLLGVAVLFIAVTPSFGQLPNSGKSDKSGKLPREEEEEPAKTKPKVTLRVDDTVSTRAGAVPIDLRREAEQARHPAARELFKKLMLAKDLVVFP